MIEVGGIYSWFNSLAPDAVTFVVVAEATHRSSKADRDGSEGFLALILDGAHRGASWEPWKAPGETFTFSKRSAMAADSKPAF